MTDESATIRRLTRWNRFWLVVTSVCVVTAGSNALMQTLINSTTRLEVNWGEGEHAARALVFSTSQGGPFVVTHLVTQAGEPHIDTAFAAIASSFVRSRPQRKVLLTGN